jgi:hypothetical protein
MYVSLNMDTDIVTNLINLFYYEILQFDRKCRKPLFTSGILLPEKYLLLVASYFNYKVIVYVF